MVRMTVACTPATDQFRCPTKWELFGQIVALLPRGRAWQTHEDVAEFSAGPSATYGATSLGGDVGAGAEGGVPRLSVLHQFWAAVAEISEVMHQRACALISEMFCESTVELAAEWGVDYGFPDSCDPWPTLCDKVRAQGGATCAYLASLAATLGYTITCNDRCPSMLYADGLAADCATAGGFRPNFVQITVHAALSPALTPTRHFAADSLVADCTPACDPVPEALICLIDRWKPAHVRAVYEVVT